MNKKRCNSYSAEKFAFQILIVLYICRFSLRSADEESVVSTLSEEFNPFTDRDIANPTKYVLVFYMDYSLKNI